MHRNVETFLRCTRCGTPICPKCLVHTPTGARCPRCGRAAGGRPGGRGVVRFVMSAAAGLAAGMLGGSILVVAPFGALLPLPILLLGLLVGGVVSNVAGGGGGPGLALLAFCSVLFGPPAGQALLIGLTSGGPSGGGLVPVAQALAPFEVLLLLVAALLAAAWAGRRS